MKKITLLSKILAVSVHESKAVSCYSGLDIPRSTRVTLDGLLRGKIIIILKIKKFSKPFY